MLMTVNIAHICISNFV